MAARALYTVVGRNDRAGRLPRVAHLGTHAGARGAGSPAGRVSRLFPGSAGRLPASRHGERSRYSRRAWTRVRAGRPAGAHHAGSFGGAPAAGTRRAPPAAITRLQAILANSHRFIHAVMALEAGLFRSQPVPARARIRRLRQQRGCHPVLPGRLFARRAGAGPATCPTCARIIAPCCMPRCPHVERYELVNVEIRPRHQQPEYAGGGAHPMEWAACETLYLHS